MKESNGKTRSRQKQTKIGRVVERAIHEKNGKSEETLKTTYWQLTKMRIPASSSLEWKMRSMWITATERDNIGTK